MMLSPVSLLPGLLFLLSYTPGGAGVNCLWSAERSRLSRQGEVKGGILLLVRLALIFAIERCCCRLPDNHRDRLSAHRRWLRGFRPALGNRNLSRALAYASPGLLLGGLSGRSCLGC